jgi:hypothetical protein
MKEKKNLLGRKVKPKQKWIFYWQCDIINIVIIYRTKIFYSFMWLYE